MASLKEMNDEYSIITHPSQYVNLPPSLPFPIRKASLVVSQEADFDDHSKAAVAKVLQLNKSPTSMVTDCSLEHSLMGSRRNS
jgi:hypothetical protein